MTDAKGEIIRMRLPVHRSLFMRMVLYFVMIISLMTIVLSYGLYETFSKSTLDNLNNAYQRNLAQVSFSSRYMNESAQNLLWSVFSNPGTTVLMYQDTHNMNEVVPEVRKLNDLVETYPFVQSIYIYNQKLDRFIATGAGAVSSSAQFYDQGAVSLLSDKERLRPSEPIARLSTSPLHPEEALNVYTYMLYELQHENGGVSGAVLVNIKAEYLQNLIQSSSELSGAAEDSQTLVLSQQGQLMNPSARRPFLSDLSAMPFFRSMKDNSTGTGWLETEIDGKQSLVTYVTSDNFNWIFVQITPYAAILAKVHHVRSVTILISLLILAFSSIAAILLSRRLYRPIGQLVTSAQRVSEAGGNPQADKDHALADLHIVQDALTRAYISNQGYRQDEKRMMLKRLITDDAISEEMAHSILEKHRLSADDQGAYWLLLVRVDHYAEFQANFSEKDRHLLGYGIVNASEELFGASHITHSIDLGEDGIAVTLCSQEAPDCSREEEAPLVSIARELQNWCRQSLRLSVTVCISSCYTSPLQLRQAYLEAKLLSNYRLVYGHGSIIHPGSLDDRLKGNDCRLSLREEQELREALIDGKNQEAMVIYDTFMAGLALHTHEVIISNVLYLTYVVHNTFFVMEQNSLDQYHLDLSKWVRQVLQAETLTQIRGMFEQMFLFSSETVRSRKLNRSSVVLESIVALIEAKYPDMNLSLDYIADEIGMSKDHISKMFRRTYNKTISEYLLDLRISKVIELMENPELEFSEILERVGVENKKYFYSLFKKKMGASLRDYRLKQLTSPKNGNSS
ncbi:MAG: AraC family transcriptional regulator [Paenibacillaceae bacterium]|jgi:AraC-like DNA-binding protein|nr:AraC family transcriptional regulator [Paenibacillaceae bacterium]